VGIGIHAVTGARRDILDVAQAERATAVLITLEFGDGGLGRVGTVEANHTTAARPTAWLVLDLGLLNLTNGGEEFNKIVIARRPGKLGHTVNQDKFGVKGGERCRTATRLTLRT
jgi:hypothetical protein